jgi:hypothetical protein
MAKQSFDAVKFCTALEIGLKVAAQELNNATQ